MGHSQHLVLHMDYNSSEESKIADIFSFFTKNPKIDAVLFLANYMGLAGLQAFRGMKFRIPEDVSVISFDDHDSFRLHTPTISVIAQPIKEIAENAIKLLMDQMTGIKPFVIEGIRKKGNLIIRESV